MVEITKKIEDMKIGNKLLLGYMAVAALVLVAGLIGLNSTNQVMTNADVILDDKVPFKDISKMPRAVTCSLAC